MTTCSKETLKNHLFRDGIDIGNISRLITSDLYVLPSRRWIERTYAPYWLVMKTTFLEGFRPGAEVCHHYAQGCAWFAGLCHAGSKTRPKNATLLFGEMGLIRPNIGHVLNFAYVSHAKGGLVLFEPQTGQIIEDSSPCTYLRV